MLAAIAVQSFTPPTRMASVSTRTNGVSMQTGSRWIYLIDSSKPRGHARPARFPPSKLEKGAPPPAPATFAPAPAQELAPVTPGPGK